MNRLPVLTVIIAALAFTISCGSDSDNPPIEIGSPSYVYVSTTAGSISGFKITSNGSLAVVPGSPFANAGANSIGMVAASSSFLYVANYGTYNISGYSFDPKTGALVPLPGSPYQTVPLRIPQGPESLAVCGSKLYSVSNTISLSTYTVGSTGALTPLGGYGSFSEGAASSLAVDPLCKYLYFADPTLNGVWVYAITGTGFQFSQAFTTPFGTGTTPVSVALDLSGKFLFVANSGSNNVSVFAVDSTSGALTQISGSPFAAGSQPSAVMVAGSYVYVTNAGSNSVSAYTFNSSTGALTPISGSPFSTGSSPAAITSANTNLNVSPAGMLIFTANQGSNNVSAFAVENSGVLQPVPGSPFAVSGTPQGVVAAIGPQ